MIISDHTDPNLNYSEITTENIEVKVPARARWRPPFSYMCVPYSNFCTWIPSNTNTSELQRLSFQDLEIIIIMLLAPNNGYI